jgi:hypothetical protein
LAEVVNPKNWSKTNGLCNTSLKTYFLRWGIDSPTPNPQAGGSPLCLLSATWGRAMLWWKGTHFTCLLLHLEFQFMSNNYWWYLVKCIKEAGEERGKTQGWTSIKPSPPSLWKKF